MENPPYLFVRGVCILPENCMIKIWFERTVNWATVYKMCHRMLFPQFEDTIV